MEPKISKEVFDALSAEQKAFYVEKDGEHVLDAAVLAKELSSMLGLKNNHEKILAELKTAKAKAKEYEAAEAVIKKSAEEKELEAKKAAGDLKGMAESYEAKIKAAREEGAAEFAKLKGDYDKLANSLVEAELFNMASEAALKGSEPLYMNAIRHRVRHKFTDNGVELEYLDEKGNATAYNRAEFMKTISGNPSFARILRGSDATGGGHQGAAAASTTNAAQGAAVEQGIVKKESRDEFTARQAKKLEEFYKKNGG